MNSVLVWGLDTWIGLDWILAWILGYMYGMDCMDCGYVDLDLDWIWIEF